MEPATDKAQVIFGRHLMRRESNECYNYGLHVKAHMWSLGVNGTGLGSFEANMMVRLLEFVGFDR